MSKITRRDTIKYTILAGISTGLLPGCQTETPADTAHEGPEGHVHESKDGLYGLSEADLALLNETFFTEAERETVRVLANLIIPADERSGNAEEAGVPAFIEFMMLDQPWQQTPLRGGLRWLHVTCLNRFEKSFVECSEAQQTELLDLIAYPQEAPPEMSQGVAFFNRFRDLVSSGFWSSKMGMEDLQYQGNVPYNWDGAPQAWLDKLGVSYKA